MRRRLRGFLARLTPAAPVVLVALAALVAPAAPAALVALVALGAAGCGSDGTNTSAAANDRSTTAPGPGTLSGDLQVFAAASLTDAFTELGKAFEAEHPKVTVTFDFAASSALAQQIDEGAPADVFAPADEASMKRVTERGNASDPRIIARNRLAILVEKGNPKGITGLADLAEPGVVLALCAPAVPCGRLADAALEKAGVRVEPASLEENVKAVVAKVTLGEADAGIVYATDVKAAGGKAEGVGIGIAGDPSLEAVYPIAVTKQARNAAAARAWIEFVRSGEGQKTLAKFGFLSP
ncbi:MAG: molybdate ABC transporter substrate-binding protein [Actinobacteria bacterium]|nr:molybdate ABC transporter substrate-binding protein [Actinomycetota bacterium]